MIMHLSLGFSPCPNDCFIFDALVNGKIDTEGLTFELVMSDVEDLNKRAFAKGIHITKLSYHAYMHLVNDYVLLNAGSALGFGCGPLLISKQSLIQQLNNSTIQQFSVAIPGKYTTANFLFSLAYPHIKEKKEMVFSEIENAVLNNKVDAGVIIHENRFTYEQKGLKKIVDLGKYWEKLTQSPIPLGGIVIQRGINEELKHKVNKLIHKSVEFAFENPQSSYEYVKSHAQEMDEDVRNKHIQLYVNKFSIDLGNEGKQAVQTMFNKAVELNLIEKPTANIFIS